jgi:hypothetical protein
MSTAQGDTIDARLRGLRMVGLGLLGGLVVIGAVVGVLVIQMDPLLNPFGEAAPIVAWVCLVVAIAALPAPLFVIPYPGGKPGRIPDDPEEAGPLGASAGAFSVRWNGQFIWVYSDHPFRAYAGAFFVKAGLLEVAAIMPLIGLLLTGYWWLLLLLPWPVVALAALIAQMPIRLAYDTWLERDLAGYEAARARRDADPGP